ncbi:hypothetical protein BDN72DRAFT_794224 [Pluteus cervinus]|uniref:Uncharacterized protein n=1 Tax=Pluteus cervinus TaxID=181527 RepID=A0ACD3AZJ7_9AGAR|nr:hypothetical protein BDN72DRAFT_794224 [Pluteus cervinus]
MVLSSTVIASGLRFNALRCYGRSLAPQLQSPRHSFARSFSLISSTSPLNRRLGQSYFVLPTRSYTKPAEQTSELAAQATTAEHVTGAATEAITAAEGVTDIVDAASIGDVATPSIAEQTADLIPAALQYGDMAAMGLASWTPAGIIQWSMELINVSTGLPWFYTLIAGSLFWRIILVPVAIKGLQNSARLLPLQPQILASQEEMKKIRESGDKLALQKHALKMRKMYKDAGVSLGASALAPFAQLPVALGLFFGVRKMCQLPVPQLQQSGLEFLPDLTVPDPYMVLPLALCAAVNLQIVVGAKELNMKERPEMGHIMNGLRFLSVAGIWVMAGLPSGLMVSLLTTAIATTVQSLALQWAPLRRYFGIPIVSESVRGRLPSPLQTVHYLTDMYKQRVAEAAAMQKRQTKPKRR